MYRQRLEFSPLTQSGEELTPRAQMNVALIVRATHPVQDSQATQYRCNGEKVRKRNKRHTKAKARLTKKLAQDAGAMFSVQAIWPSAVGQIETISASDAAPHSEHSATTRNPRTMTVGPPEYRAVLRDPAHDGAVETTVKHRNAIESGEKRILSVPSWAPGAREVTCSTPVKASVPASSSFLRIFAMFLVSISSLRACCDRLDRDRG
jgi:hypothetical protein